MLQKVFLRRAADFCSTSAASRGVYSHSNRRRNICKQNEWKLLHRRCYSVRLNHDTKAAAAFSAPVGLSTEVQNLYDTLKTGNRRSLAKAITLVESTRMNDRAQANALVEAILQEKAKQEQNRELKSFRIGLSGPPGVGKSTFIEAFGMHLVKMGHKVAVLAVDPSSVKRGGSILGDKTRMVELSRAENAYVRPSPSCGTLGGVTAHSNEVILLLEQAGYNIILVETVGVGQSETAVEDMVDMYVLLASPAGGDELQGIKRGVVELADLIVVNKADGELVNAARRSQYEYLTALKFVRPKTDVWQPQVTSCSAITGDNIPNVWNTMHGFWKLMEVRIQHTGEMSKRRARQRQLWMWKIVHDELEQRLTNLPALQTQLPLIQVQIENGELSPTVAARRVLQTFFQPSQQ